MTTWGVADDALVARFKSGDADAIRQVYREYAGAVTTVARSIVRDAELTADVVQQTFLKAWRSADRFDGSGEISSWLYAIARRTAIDTLRSESKPTRGGHEPEVEVGVDDLAFDRTWIQFEVRAAIDALPADEREVIRRSHLLGETHRQIAEAMGVPVGTVKSRSGRAFKRLAAALDHLDANQVESPDVVKDEEGS